jgi:hypothetical protein
VKVRGSSYFGTVYGVELDYHCPRWVKKLVGLMDMCIIIFYFWFSLLDVWGVFGLRVLESLVGSRGALLNRDNEMKGLPLL